MPQEFDLDNNMAQIVNIAGNATVLTRQMHSLAYDQWAAEFEAGSRSHSRQMLLAGIGTELINIEYKLKQIITDIELLKLIDIDLQPKEPDNCEIVIMR